MDPVQLPRWWLSRTTIVQIMTGIVFVLNQCGVTVAPDYMNSIVNLICDLGIVIGGTLTVYFHWKAKRNLAAQANQAIATLNTSTMKGNTP